MPEQAYDTQTIPFTAKITGDKPLKVKQVNFVVTVTKPNGLELEKTGTQESVDNAKFPRAATHNFSKLVPDDLDYYEVKANAWWKSPSGGGKVEAGETTAVRVWPDEIEIKFTADDAKACEKVEFNLVPEAGKATKRMSNDTGLWKARGPLSKFTIETLPPWEILSTIRGTGRLREYKINKKSYTATIISPKPDAKTPKTTTLDPDDSATKLSVYKQYVNLPSTDPWDASCPAGHIVKIKVGVSDPNIAQEGDIILIKCEFKKQADTKRTSPKVQLSGDNLVQGTLKPASSGKIYTGQVKLEADKTAWFNVKLGIAGGDVCIIKVGTTDPPKDAELVLQNWRKVNYELLLPKCTGGNRVTDHTKNLDPKLLKDMTDKMEPEFNKVCIEFDCVEKQPFDKQDITKNINSKAAKCCVLPKKWFYPGETGDVHLAAIEATPPDPFDIKCDHLQLIEKMAKHTAQKQTFNVIIADYLVVLNKFTINTPGEKKGAKFKPIAPGYWFLPHGIRDFGNVLTGKPSVKRVGWKAVGWRDKSSSTWNTIADPSQPGGKYMNLTEFSVDSDIQKILKMEKASEWEILLTNAPGFPGELLNSSGYLEDSTHPGKYLKISVLVEGVNCFPIGGCALLGKVLLETWGGKADGKYLATTMLHEIGHNMGMTYIGENEVPASDKKWGRKAKYDIPGFPPTNSVPTPTNSVPTGYYYVEHGHRGAHCAYNASLSDRGKNTDYKSLPGAGACVMFGCGQVTKYCPHCLKHLRNEDLSDITKVWIVRKTT